MGRGIETSKIFRTRKDREDFIDRLAELCWAGSWARLCLGVDAQPFSPAGPDRKRTLGPEHAAPDDRLRDQLQPADKRRGHLFQNRYKSIVCQEDLYLLELTRYIHLYPSGRGWSRTWRRQASILGPVIPHCWARWIGTDRISARSKGISAGRAGRRCGGIRRLWSRNGEGGARSWSAGG